MTATALTLSLLLVGVIAASGYMLYRSKERPHLLRMVLTTKLVWSIIGAIALLYLILSGKLSL